MKLVHAKYNQEQYDLFVDVAEHQRAMARLEHEAREAGLCKSAFMQAVADAVPSGDYRARIRHASSIVRNLKQHNRV